MIKEPSGFRAASINTDELANYFYAVAAKIGNIPPPEENGLSIGVEVFTLSEGFGISPYSLQALWQHSVHTGYLAALIAIDQQLEPAWVWRAFVGGLLHDIGILIFLTQQPLVYLAVVDLAQSRGQDLGAIEKNFLGATHAEYGANFLARWGVGQDLLDIVKFHDEPFQGHQFGFSPLTAVYIANVIEGGGIAQDGDGVVGPECEAYLRHLGVWDDLPSWQRWLSEMAVLSE